MTTLVGDTPSDLSESFAAEHGETRVRALSCCCRIYFAVDTLKDLAMGGRIGGAAPLLGSVLQVKPVLAMVSDIPAQPVPPAVVTHDGPGVLGVGFFVEP
jgi:fatty acid-binding protein DegV